MNSDSTVNDLPSFFAIQDDPETTLPFLQLGDIFTKGNNDPVYAVMSAACDLQFAPEDVSKSRVPDRNDTILLLPGTLCLPNECPDKSLSTGLIKINGNWRAIVWDRQKLTGIPHCLVRPILQENEGYNHLYRLRTARALELQQKVFHEASRIGLEVQPRFADEMDFQMFVKTTQGYEEADEAISGGVIRFHIRDNSVLVFKQSAIEKIILVLTAASSGETEIADEAKLTQLVGRIEKNASLLSRTPLVEHAAEKVGALKAAEKSQPLAIDGLGLVVQEPSTDINVGKNRFCAIVRIGNHNG